MQGLRHELTPYRADWSLGLEIWSLSVSDLRQNGKPLEYLGRAKVASTLMLRSWDVDFTL